MNRKLASLAMVLGATCSWPQQQPTEWRPSIAEDNKTATWDQTAAFLVGSIGGSTRVEAPCVLHLSVPSTFDNLLGIKLSDEASLILSVDPRSFADQIGLRPGMQILEVRIDRTVPKGTIGIPAFLKAARLGDAIGFRVRTGNETVLMRGKLTSDSARIPHSLNATLLASRIDPLSIAVLGNLVRLSGTDNQSMAEDDDKEPLKGSIRFQLDDDEIAKRVARALMHAALLCGGTKAVSPF